MQRCNARWNVHLKAQRSTIAAELET
jgi:hypothetical protein